MRLAPQRINFGSAPSSTRRFYLSPCIRFFLHDINGFGGQDVFSRRDSELQVPQPAGSVRP